MIESIESSLTNTNKNQFMNSEESIYLIYLNSDLET